MAREIKFRGYSTEQKRWVYGYYAKIIDHYIFSVEGKIKVDPTSVGQFTGLLDDIGEYIYEGDLFYDCDVALLWCDTCKGFAFFSYIDGKEYCYQCAGDISWSDVVTDGALEVVGNIYETPEWGE